MFGIMLKLIKIPYYLHCRILIGIVLFANKTAHQQVNLLNDIILNVFTNFVPNKVITCDDRDPPWINDNIKNKIRWKNSMYKNYKRNDKKTEDYELLTEPVSEVSQLIEKSNDEYY